jgi:ABC-2 type transport system ATP-binding protein
MKISIKDLRKSYGKNEVLKGINLEVASGEIIGYIGPNGAGKSTTLKILTGIIPNFEGQVLVDGIDVRLNPLEVKKRIGYIPENAILYDTLTPHEYLKFVGQLHAMDSVEINKKVKNLLEIVDLGDKINARMTSFSKGMRQKVLLIAGMIHNPDIIFLDEPLSGLDANAVILVKEILLQLRNSGKTILYSSHLMDVVEKISDRIVIIFQGEVIANGSFEELNTLSHHGSLEQLFSQLTKSENTSTDASDFIEALK